MGQFKRAIRNAIGKSFFMKFAILHNNLKPKRKTDKSIAFLIGFSSWKYDYIQSYLKDYHVRFFRENESYDVIRNESAKYKLNDQVFIVWGYKSQPNIETFAKKKGIPFYRIEDGFIRSVQLGASKSTPLSLCMDSQALYYDSTRPSDLEDLLNTYDFRADLELLNRARNAIKTLKELNISKYNNVRSKRVESIYGVKTKERILVIGQVEDDESIKRGCSRPMTNNDLVWLAKSENPNSEIIYKPHPDVLFGKRPMQSNPDEVKHISKVITEPLSISDAFQTIDRVYTITSLSGFEALLRGIPVTTIGAPFYSGWGLTDDRQKVSRRNRILSLEEVFAAAYILYPKYMHPFIKEFISIEEAIQTLKEMRDIEEQSNIVETGKVAILVGVDEKIKKYVTNLIMDFHKTICANSIEEINAVVDSYSDITFFVYDSKEYKNLRKAVKDKGYPTHYIKMGPIRTVGYLPSIFSLCLDHDLSTSSKLLNLLNTYDFHQDQKVLLRANHIIKSIVEKGLNGINLAPTVLFNPKDKVKRKVLVLGEEDLDNEQTVNLSIEDIIWTAKIENPDAEIIFKPHPNHVIVSTKELSLYKHIEHVATILKEPINLSDVLVNVSHVYTVKSLGGFEALLRGIKVITFGSPFYAGWGLTEDRAKPKNRKRTLNLGEIFAATYILYPKYFHPFTKREITIEQAISLIEVVKEIENKRNSESIVQLFEQKHKKELDVTVSSGHNTDFNLILKEDGGKIGILSKGIQAIPNLQSFFKGEIVFNPSENDVLTYIAGWGMKPSAQKALDFSKKFNVPYLGLEDGFLRSVGLGVDGSPPLSICVDDQGIYYDATRPSRLENILNSEGWEEESLLKDANRAMGLIKENYLSKYNHAPMIDDNIFGNRERILVVDQTLGDMSISLGLADKGLFREMYETAKKENPNADIYIKTHPDVISGKKEGNLSPKEIDATFIYADCNPLSLIEKVDKIYVVTSQFGFEALMLGREVHCFGMPFYAGWGVTKDRLTVERRKKQRSVEEIFAAAYILYPRYINPYTGLPGTIFDVIKYLTEHK